MAAGGWLAAVGLLNACAPRLSEASPGAHSPAAAPRSLRIAVPTNADGAIQPIWSTIVEAAGGDGASSLVAVPLPFAPSTPTPSGTPTYDLALGLSAALANGGPERPDFIAIHGITVAPLADAGLILPLDAAIAADRAFRADAYLPGALDLGRLHGHQVALPIGAVPSALAYDPALWAQAGLAPPTGSWDRRRFLAAAATLTRPAGQGTPGQWGFRPSVWACWQFLLADGVPIVQADGRSSGLGTPAAVQSLRALADTWSVQKVSPAPGSPPALVASTIALTQLELGAALNGLLPTRIAEPPRGKAQATRLDTLAAVAMTPAAADPARTVAALRQVQAAADRFALLPARLAPAPATPEPYPGPLPSNLRPPDAAELAALRAMGRYGRGIPGDLSTAVNGTLAAFLNGRLSPEQAAEQMGAAAQRVLQADG